MTDSHNVRYSTPSEVANFFLEKARKKGVPITPMKLLKLVYLGYAWCLSVLGEKLFEEDIVAWKFGPVVPSLYHEFKHFGGKPIDCLSKEYDPFDSIEPFAPKIPADHSDVIEALGIVWDLYGDKTASSLMQLTHKTGSPWYQVFDGNHSNKRIPDDIIKSYYDSYIGSLTNAQQ